MIAWKIFLSRWPNLEFMFPYLTWKFPCADCKPKISTFLRKFVIFKVAQTEYLVAPMQFLVRAMEAIALLLTHWGWATHICISNLTIIGSDNGLSPGRRQAIIWTNAGILLIWPFGTKFSEILFSCFHSRKCIWICCLRIVNHFVSASMCC